MSRQIFRIVGRFSETVGRFSVNSSAFQFECQEDTHFKTQPGPVAKNATPRPLAGN